VAAHPGDGEDALHDQAAREDAGDGRAQEAHDGQERDARRVVPQDGALGQALGARGAHPVLAEHLEQARAEQARDGGGERQPQRDRR
jgi:hypothetical protein